MPDISAPFADGQLNLSDAQRYIEVLTGSTETPFEYTVFPDVKAQSGNQKKCTWGEFVTTIRTPKEHSKKSDCPLIVMGTFGNTLSTKGSLRHAENLLTVTGIDCDYDGEKVSIETARETLMVWGIRAVLYTTASHTPAHPRWRVILPLSRPHQPQDRTRLVDRVDGLFGGILAKESWTLSQSYFFGKVSGVDYTALESTGDCIDTLEGLDSPPSLPDTNAPKDAAKALEVNAIDTDSLPASDEQIRDVRATLDFLASKGHGDKYPDWEGVGQELKAFARMGNGARTPEVQGLFADYSRQCKNHRGDDDVLRKWEQLSGTRTGIGALFRRAEKLGFKNPATVRKLARNDGHERAAISDVQISRKLVNLMMGRFLFEHAGRGWLIYGAGAWHPCKRNEQQEIAKEIGPILFAEAYSNPNGLSIDDAKRLAALAVRASGKSAIDAALKLAQSDPLLASHPTEFDTDRELLNCRNGIVHLTTGELRSHDPAIRMSRQCTVEFSTAPPARWLRFLSEICMQDHELVAYLQRVCGYTLTGHVRDEILFFMLGRGANGKSVFANVLRKIMGSYAVILPSESLMPSRKDANAATPATAQLPGARLALANEVESGSKLSGQQVKGLCSTEAIPARHLFGSQFSFVPTHKLIVRGNHRPIVTDNDDGIWRRIHLIPFEAQFTAEQKDVGLEDALIAEAPKILGWMVQGAVAYFKQGVGTCQRVQAGSMQYRKDSDLLGQWIEDNTDQAPAFEWIQNDAYANYRAWCIEQGLNTWSKKSFTAGLAERGHRARQTSTGDRARVYLGLKLRTTDYF